MRSVVLALAVALPLLAAAEPPLDPGAALSFASSVEPRNEAPAQPPAEAEAEPLAQAESKDLEVLAVSHGQASFYAKRFHGRRTASGEPHDAEALTAAHRNLPFGTWVRVHSLYTGREVEVRINDRGPFTRGRVIDLSRAAAQALGMLQAGTHAVKLQVLGLPER